MTTNVENNATAGETAGNHVDIRELQVLNNELEFFLRNEMPSVYKFLGHHLDIVLKSLRGVDITAPVNNSVAINQHAQRFNLASNNYVLRLPYSYDTIKCSLSMTFDELRNVEIYYKPSPRHNNYIYKSREDMAWHLFQIKNAWDSLASTKANMAGLACDTSLEQALFNVDRLLEAINTARNILLFPKKRSIAELQAQKNMKIFALVPNDLVFSFYIQGFKLILAIYSLKPNESTKHLLECQSIAWLNNTMVLLTACLQKLQQTKDKLIIFEQLRS